MFTCAASYNLIANVDESTRTAIGPLNGAFAIIRTIAPGINPISDSCKFSTEDITNRLLKGALANVMLDTHMDIYSLKKL